MAEKKSYLEVVAGRDIRASDDHHEVIEQLADILDRLIGGLAGCGPVSDHSR